MPPTTFPKYKIDTMGRATSYLRMSRHFSQNVLDVLRLNLLIDNFSEKWYIIYILKKTN